jgi:cytochrome oxidase assembly protein ShyY1
VRSLGFLVSRRWILFAVTVALLAYAAWLLGEWQFHRLEDRKASNAVVARNEAAPVAPVEDVLAPGREVDPEDQWRRVTATGTYAVEDTVIVRYRTRDGASGIDVVVPLETSQGPSLLVDRGWTASDNRGTDPEDVPPPPTGTVTVTGWVRVDATGDSTAVTDRSTRAIDSDEIGAALDREVYGGFVDLVSEDPPAPTPLEPAELPELDNGRDYFSGLEGWFFVVHAVLGFSELAFEEWRRLRLRSATAPADEPTPES